VAGLDFKQPYLTRGLIAYIGNKRALFPFLADAFSRCAEEFRGPGPADRPLRFLDPFAGSGGVSRLGRALGWAVRSNDRERYAALIARCRLVLSPGRLEAAFAAEGGAERAFGALDAFARGAAEETAALVAALPDEGARDRWTAAFARAAESAPYLARHYAPARTETADWRTERLFYTAENARFLDRAREAVEALYPQDPLAEASSAADAKAALLDALLYEAATRVNTSGVFKACHRGFGGHGKDALSRITAPMRLRPPDLIDGPEALVGAADAASFCAAAGSAEVAYLDPPYNQHQYGSNYHLLTTIARWDKPAVPEDRDGSGFLLDRSGIRSDWTETRSDFCRRGRAGKAFAEVLDAIDARFVLVSYNDGGILPLEELRELLEERGAVRVESVPYVAYRGGKQSPTRTERTRELLFVVDTASLRGTADSGAREELRRVRARGALEALRKGRFDPRLPAPATCRGLARIAPDGRLELDAAALGRCSPARLEAAAAALRPRGRGTNAEAFDLVLGLLRERAAAGAGRREVSRLVRDALALLAKIAFRKYAAEYGARSAALRAALAGGSVPGIGRPLAALDALDARAALRGVALGGAASGVAPRAKD
jgi:adenine-specific DNA-methyltransferase